MEASVPVNKLTMTCEHCNESVKCTEPITTDCPLPSEGKRNHCFVLWKLESNASATITMKVQDNTSFLVRQVYNNMIFFRDVF